MAKFWKELIGGQIKNGMYVAGPRHASSKIASFSTGTPPRLPFQFIVHFDLNPNILGTIIHGMDPYAYAQMVKTVDMPGMAFTVDKRPKYNKNVPVILTKEFKDFNVVVHDDVNSTWMKFWQIYYNYHFTDGRHVQQGDVQIDKFYKDVHNDKKILPEKQFRSQFDGQDLVPATRSQFIDNIHVYQLHGETVTRTTAVNPIITDATFTPLDYAGAGTSQEITFAMSYEKLMYCPVMNFDFDEEGVFLKDAIRDMTKATPFNPSADALRGIVKGLFGLSQRSGNRRQDVTAINTRPRTDFGADLAKVEFPESDQVGFFGNLVRNAVRKKANQLTDGLLKKNNKNLNRFKI